MNKNLVIGANVKYNKEEQLIASVKEAISYHLNTFMFYTGAPQNTVRSDIDDFKTIEAMKWMKENGIHIANVIVHAPYIINLGNRKNLNFGIQFLLQELTRCDQLGISYLVLHPGSHVGEGIEVGIQNVIEGLNQLFENYHGNTMILLETMAGKGSELGSNFHELKQIIEGVTYSNRLGVCLDTCHLHDAGYDMSHFDDVLAEFDSLIGISKIHCIHINDSKYEQGSHKDRHENIGYGKIGFENLLHVLYHEKLMDIPKILETPYIDNQYPPYKYEVEMIRNQKWNARLLEEVTDFYKS